MIYEVRARLFFIVEDEGRDFYHDCEMAFPKSVAINPQGDNMEFSVIELLENHHENEPNEPCTVLKSLSSPAPAPD